MNPASNPQLNDDLAKAAAQSALRTLLSRFLTAVSTRFAAETDAHYRAFEAKTPRDKRFDPWF